MAYCIGISENPCTFCVLLLVIATSYFSMSLSQPGLQIARNLIQVGAILYSPDIKTAFTLVDNPTKQDLVGALWRMPYMAGATNTAGGLRRMTKMFADLGRPGVKHIAVLLTDGNSNIDQKLTVPDAAAAKAAGIELYVVGKGVRCLLKQWLSD